MSPETESNVLEFSKTRKENMVDKSQYLTFKVGQENYGIKLVKNKEVIKPRQITNVPHTEEYVMGVINLRGQIVPVINLGDKLELSREQDNINEENSRIIVVQVDETLIGIKVDRVEDVVAINDEEIESINENKREISQEYIKGVFSFKETLVIILDINKILFGINAM